MLETLSRLLVYGVFKQFLSGGNIVRKDTARKNELPEVFTQDVKVERDLLSVRVRGIKGFV